MKSKKKLQKKLIFGLVAVATAAGILSADLAHNVSVAEAKQNTFTQIQPYTTTGLKVLEIAPTTEDLELGYFFQKQARQEQVKNLTFGTKFNYVMEGLIPEITDADIDAELNRLWTSGNDWEYSLTYYRNYQNYQGPYDGWAWGGYPTPTNAQQAEQFWKDRFRNDVAQNLRNNAGNAINTDIYLAVELMRYGMIQPFGADRIAKKNAGNFTDSDYPIYDDNEKGIFGGADDGEHHQYDMPTGTMRQGHYVYAANGSYHLADGYVIGESGKTYPSGYDGNGNVTGEVELDTNWIYRIRMTDVEVTAPGGPGAGDDADAGDNDADTGDDDDADAGDDDADTGNDDDADAGDDDADTGNDDDADTGNGTGTRDGVEVRHIDYIPIGHVSGLPEGVTFVGTGKGNIEFVYAANQQDIYRGYSTDKVFYLDSNRYYQLGGWIREYILGDAELTCPLEYRGMTIEEFNNNPAIIQQYDLIYLSGRASEYQALNNGAGVDLSAAAVQEIYNQSAIYHKAVIMDYLLFDGEENGALKGNLSNFDKLALLLWQEDQKDISSWAEVSAYFRQKPAEPGEDPTADPEYLIDDINGVLRNAGVFITLHGTMMKGYNGTFAINNIYVYNHHFSDFQESRLADFQIDALDNIANGDLKRPYTSAAANAGFQAVLAYIKWNNQGLVAGKMTEGIVTPAIAIQYILCYDGEDLIMAKGTYRVLEIQPSRQFRFNSTAESRDYTLETAEVKLNRDTFIKNCLNESIVQSSSQDLVSFESMTIDEFNTMQEDLLTNFDVIYIGSLHDTYFKNVDCNSAALQAGNRVSRQASVPQYNDTTMTGYVYFAVGDKTAATVGRETAYTSRDLTVAKLSSLKNYLMSSGLIIVDGDLMCTVGEKGNKMINPTEALITNTTYYDHGRIDNSSNMYQLFAFGKGEDTGDGSPVVYYSNFVSETDVAAGYVKKADLTNSLNRERLDLNLTKTPAFYTYNTYDNTPGYMSTVYYLTPEADGKYYLDFEFSFSNTSEAAAIADFYVIHFYQDLNANGRFEATEEKTDYTVTLMGDGSQAASGTDADGVTRYSLNTDVMYRLRRQVPSDEGGYINWCIRIEKVTNSSVYCQESGSTAIKPREQKYINILQITPDGNASTINLEALKDNDALYRYLHATAVEDQYIINVRTVTVSQFQRDTQHYYTTFRNNFDSEDEMWVEFFNTFERTAADNAGYTNDQIKNDEDRPMSVNMIILGFGGNYTQFTEYFPINALEAYMGSNRPLLTTNNVIGPDIRPTILVNGQRVNNPDRTKNYRFADDFWQDRYGYTDPRYNVEDNNINTDTIYDRSEALIAPYIANREGINAIAYSPGSGRNSIHTIPIAYTNTVRAKVSGTRNAGFINTAAVNDLYAGNDPTVTKGATRTYVDKMNEGQIVHYPYEIGDRALLSKTDAQYFQLDLDTLNGDGDPSVIVWYTLGDVANGAGTPISDANIYSATPGDGINNYYIYNAGNVTFSGIGANGTLTVDESQLFVNTLIAAYESGLVDPTVSFYETADSNAAMLDSIAVPYDRNVTKDNPIDSSIMLNERGNDYLYKFVNPNTQAGVEADGTKAYFKIQDSNNVTGEKIAKVTFYLGVEDTVSGEYTLPDGGGTVEILHIQLKDNTIVPVVKIPINVYTADFSTRINTDDTSLSVGTVYGFYAPMSYLKDNGAAKIYIQADTGYMRLDGSTGQYRNRPLGTAYDMFTIIKQDLLKLD